MKFTTADYVLKRLSEQGVDTLFGVPAAYCASMFEAAPGHGITSVVTASDLEAGYAADGYARTKGLAAVSVAYGVGALSMINAIAGAFVERSPVVVVNGGPGERYLDRLRRFDVVFSHSIGKEATDLAAYQLVTAAALRAGWVTDVPRAVDDAIRTAITKKRPVYIEINLDIWDEECPMPAGPLVAVNPPAGTEHDLAAAIIGLIRAAHAPLILIGTEVQRYGLADSVATLIARLGVPWVGTLLAKSALSEQDAGFIGVYDPPHSRAAVQNAVANADLLVMFGGVFSGGYVTLLQDAFDRMVHVYDGKVRIKAGVPHDAEIGALVTALAAAAATAAPRPVPAGNPPPQASPVPVTGTLTYAQVFERIGAALDASWIVIPDTFLGIYSAANLPVQGRDAFLCNGVWLSLGHSVAAAVGASFGSARRPLVICGDGGFHMTAQALSTMVQYRRNPVVIVIANGIYGYEEYLIDKPFFNDPTKSPNPFVVLNQWDFVRFAKGLGLQFAEAVDTAARLDSAIAAAKAHNGPALIVAQINSRDLPVELSGM